MQGPNVLLNAWRKSLVVTSFTCFFIFAFVAIAKGEHVYEPRLIDGISESWRWREYPELKGRGLSCLNEGPDGAMWFGVDGGALRYDGIHWSEFNQSNGLEDTATAFASTSDGFYGSTNSGIYAFENEHWEKVFPGSSDRVWIIEDVISAGDGSLWAATNWGAVQIVNPQSKQPQWNLYATEQIAAHFDADQLARFHTVVVDTPETSSWKLGLGIYVYGPIPNGQTIIGMADDGPAASAGLNIGDQIVGIDGEDRRSVYQTELETGKDDPIRLTVKLKAKDELVSMELTPVDISGSVELFRPYSIAEGPDGTLWFATRLGAIISLSLPSSEARQWKNHTKDYDLPKIAIPSMTATPSGVAAVGRSTNSKALIQFDGRKWHKRNLQRAIGSSIASLQDGNLLVGAGGALISVSKSNAVVRSAKEFGLVGTDLLVKQTSDGAVWVAGKKSTLFRVEPQGKNWTTYNGLNYQDTDAGGAEWFISNRLSIVKRDGDRWREYDSSDGLMSFPMTLLATKSGDVWAAGSHHGIAATARLENGKWVVVEHPRLSWSIDRRSAFEDRDGRVWFGGASRTNAEDQMVGGAIRFDGKTWTHIEPTNRLSFIYGLCQTLDGSVWCGGPSLVQILPDDHFGSLSNVSSKAHGYCEACAADRHGNLWIGTRAYGLAQMTKQDDGTWASLWFDETNGMSKNRITNIHPLNDGTVIAHTFEGFHRFDGKSWTTPAFPEELASQLDYASIRQAPDGAVWLNVSSLRSISQETVVTDDFVLPGSYRTRRYLPDIRPPETALESNISEVLVGDAATFTLSGTDPWNVTSATHLTYSWRVDEGEWSPFSPMTVLTLSDLPSGFHRLEVRCRDRDFNVDPTPEMAEFRVLPLLQDRIWFRVLMLFTLGLLGIAAIQTSRVFRREANLQVANRELVLAEHELNVANLRLEDRVVERTNKLRETNEKLLREIDDRIAAEARLRESEQRYRSLVEMLPNGVVRIDLAGRVTFGNHMLAKMHGCERDELIGRHIWDFQVDRVRREFLKQYFQHLVDDQPTPSVYETQNRTKDGRQIDVEAIWTYDRDADDNVLGFISVISDVTERKRAEQLILEENALLEAVAQGEPLSQTLDRLTSVVEMQLPDVIASVLLLSDDGLRLSHGSGSNLPTEYRVAIDGGTIGEAAGSCYTAAFRAEPVIVSDIANDPLWRDYRDLALQHGLAACWSMPIKDPSGEVLGTFAVYCKEPRSPTSHELRLIDTATHLAAVTIGRNRFQDRLRESEQRFRTMFEQAAVGVTQVDSHSGTLLRVNERYCDIIGVPESELVGKTWMELTHPDDLEADQSRIDRLVNGEIREFSVEKRIIKNDGSIVWIDLNAAAMWRPNEAATEHIAIVQDITERKNAEEERERRHQTLAKLDETVRSLFISTRNNEPFFESVCRDIETLISVDLCAVPMVDAGGTTFTYQAARGRNSDLLRDKTMPISGGGLCGWVIENYKTLLVPDLTNDNRVLPALARSLEVTTAILAPLSIDGRVVGGLSVFRAEKPFTDFELRTLNLYAQSVAAAYDNRQTLSSLESRVAERTNELAETNAELESFARTVSHDLRAPLRAMEGFAAALAEDYGHQVDEEGREFIQHIIDSAKRLDGMVADLLAYSRLGRTELRVSSFSLNDIVKEVTSRLRAEISAQAAVIDIAEDMPYIIGHKSTLVQVVTNLVSNALKFVANDTPPEIRIWSEKPEEGKVRLTIEDNGIGVEPGYQKRIFQVFERLHGIESYPGTGIGLAIVARACERLGGSCGMDSVPGHGSKFWVEFPEGQVDL